MEPTFVFWLFEREYPSNTNNVIARVGNSTLSPEDIIGLNFGDNPEDSLILLGSFAHKWVEEQVLYQRAQKELASSSSTFESNWRHIESRCLFIHINSNWWAKAWIL